MPPNGGRNAVRLRPRSRLDDPRLLGPPHRTGHNPLVGHHVGVRINVIGYPSSAAAYCVGVEEAPRALREAGLLERLQREGHEVRDLGDLPVHLWRPDQRRPRAQNLEEEVGALHALADAVAPLIAQRRDDERLLVIGGSCTVAVGACAAMIRAGLEPQILYVDRHLDLNTPESTDEGSLSWMGMAHALDLDGAATELAGAAGRRPMLRPRSLSYLGVNLEREVTDWERDRVEELGIRVTEQAAMVADPAAAARQARRALPDGPFLVHLDVDVLDFQDAPLAENVNGRNTGPTLGDLGSALDEIWREPECLGLSIGQLVPAHAASDPTAISRLLDAIAPPVDN